MRWICTYADACRDTGAYADTGRITNLLLNVQTHRPPHIHRNRHLCMASLLHDTCGWQPCGELLVLDSKDPHGLETDKGDYRWEVQQGGLRATVRFHKRPTTRLHPAMGLHPEEESIIKIIPTTEQYTAQDCIPPSIPIPLLVACVGGQW